MGYSEAIRPSICNMHPSDGKVWVWAIIEFIAGIILIVCGVLFEMLELSITGGFLIFMSLLICAKVVYHQKERNSQEQAFETTASHQSNGPEADCGNIWSVNDQNLCNQDIEQTDSGQRHTLPSSALEISTLYPTYSLDSSEHQSTPQRHSPDVLVSSYDSPPRYEDVMKNPGHYLQAFPVLHSETPV